MRALLAAILVASLGCAASPRTPPPATATAAPPAPKPEGDPGAASPEALTRAWVAAVEAGDWERFVSLVHPDVRPGARAALPALTPEKQGWMQKTAAKLRRALASGPPTFVPAPALSNPPAHVDWYYCRTTAPALVTQGPCTFSVAQAEGRWYFLSLYDPEHGN
jgi:hypothetical protein